MKLPAGVRLSKALHFTRMSYHLRYPLLRAFGRLGLFKVNRKLPSGLQLVLDVEDKVQLQIYRNGSWEGDQLPIMKNILRAGDVFADAGAHCGLFAANIAYDQRSVKVLAFEPNPRLVQLLRATKDMNRLANLEIVEHALSDQVAELDFYVSTGAADSLAGLKPRRRASERIKVKAIPLGAALRDRGIDAVRLLKMDIEGAEAIVLPACRDLFEAGVIEAILLELHVDLVSAYGGTADDLLRLLGDYYTMLRCAGAQVVPLESDWRAHIEPSNCIHVLALHRRAFPDGNLQPRAVS